MKNLTEKIQLLFVFYPIYLLGGLLFQFLQWTGRIQVVGRGNIPRNLGKLIFLPNHPSLMDPILISLLFFKQHFWHPFWLTPWNIPEKTHYYDPWYFWWLRCRLIPVKGDRNRLSTNRKAIQKMVRVLQANQTLILFPEGSRTFKGKEFVYSRTGKRLRPLKGGVALILEKTKALAVPVWIDNTNQVLPNGKFPFPRFWKAKIVIKVGTILSPRGLDRSEIMEKITTALLELADQ